MKRIHRRYTIFGLERGFNNGEFCPDLFDYFLVLRHPLERINSLASTYMKETPMDKLFEAIRHNKKDVFPWMHWLHTDTEAGKKCFSTKKGKKKCSGGDGIINFDNALVRFLAADSRIYRAPLGSINGTAFEQAKRTLDQFSLVMTTQLMEKSPTAAAALFAGAPLHWKLFPKKESRTNHHSPHLLNESQIEFFRSTNQYDMKLWEYVLQVEKATLSRLRR